VCLGLSTVTTHVFGFGLDGIKPGGPPFASPINDTREYRTMLALATRKRTCAQVSRPCET